VAEEEELLELLAAGVEAAAWVEELEGVGVEDEDVWMNSAGATEGVGVGVAVDEGVGVDEGVALLLELWQASGGATPAAHRRVPSAIPLQTSSALMR